MNKKGFIAILYRSPSQSNEEFEVFLVILMFYNNGQLQTRIIKMVWIWHEGVQIDSFPSTHVLKQLICEPTNILSKSLTCIDLIFKNQPNLVVDSDTHPSLYLNCDHPTIHCKINFQVEYQPPYERHVWNYAKDAILSTSQNVDCHPLFASNTVHQQVNLLHNIPNNFKKKFP